MQPTSYGSAGLFLIRTSTRPAFGARGIEFINDTAWQIFGYNNLAEYIPAALFLIGIVHLFRTKRDRSLLLIAVVAVTFLVSLALSYRMPMLPKYVIFLPFLFISAAAAYRPVYFRYSHRAAVYIFIIALLIINMPFLH